MFCLCVRKSKLRGKMLLPKASPRAEKLYYKPLLNWHDVTVPSGKSEIIFYAIT